MVEARHIQDNRPDTPSQRASCAHEGEGESEWKRQVKCVQIATHWDCLIAAHVYAGDEVDVIAKEFGLYPMTISIVMKYLSPETYSRWLRELAGDVS